MCWLISLSFFFFFFFFYFFQLTVSAFLYSFNRMAFLKDRMLSFLLCFARVYVLVGCWRDVTAITIMGVKTSRCSLCALVFLPLSQVGACSGCWQHLFVVCPALSHQRRCCVLFLRHGFPRHSAWHVPVVTRRPRPATPTLSRPLALHVAPVALQPIHKHRVNTSGRV